MKALPMIDALCSMGNVEGVGRFATPYKDDIADFMKDMFGNQIDYIIGEETLIEDYNYVYSYNELIKNYIADAVIVLLDGTEIFLYEIDD